LARHATAIYDAFLSPTGLRVTQYGVLARLDHLLHCNLAELAKACELDVTSLSRGIRPLTDAGLVRVSSGKDARTKRYELTPRGKRRLAQAYPLWKEAQNRIHGVISAKQIVALEDLSNVLRK